MSGERPDSTTEEVESDSTDSDGAGLAPIASTAGADDTDATDATEPTDLRFVGPATAEALSDSEWSVADVADGDVTYEQLVAAGVNPGVAARVRREHSLTWSLEGDGLDRRSEQVRGLGDGEREWVAAAAEGTADGDADATDGEAAWRASDGEDVDEAEEASDGDPTAGEAAWREATADWAGADVDDRDETPEWPGHGVDADDAGAWGAAEPATGSARGGDDGGDDGGREATVAGERAWRDRSASASVETLDAVTAGDAAALAEAGVTSVRSLATVDPELVADLLDRDRETVAAWRDAAADATE